MPEHDTIAATRPLPATVRSLVDDLASIGVVDGSVLIVHSSLSSLGWVCGGAVAVIEAIKIAIGRSGTVVMPTHTSDLSEPSNWCNPRVPPEWWPIIRDSMPAFDPRVTPSRAMGQSLSVFERNQTLCAAATLMRLLPRMDHSRQSLFRIIQFTVD